MTPPIFEPRVLSSPFIGQCHDHLLNISLEEQIAHCRLPDYKPFDEMQITDMWGSYSVHERIIERQEFGVDNRPYWLQPSLKNGPNYRFVRPERRNEVWK